MTKLLRNIFWKFPLNAVIISRSQCWWSYCFYGTGWFANKALSLSDIAQREEIAEPESYADASLGPAQHKYVKGRFIGEWCTRFLHRRRRSASIFWSFSSVTDRKAAHLLFCTYGRDPAGAHEYRIFSVAGLRLTHCNRETGCCSPKEGGKQALYPYQKHVGVAEASLCRPII